MINNKFILNMNSKDLTEKAPKVNNEKVVLDKTFEKVLNNKIDKPAVDEIKKSNNVDKKAIVNNDEVELKDDSNLKSDSEFKDVNEVINKDDENFQGNKSEGEMLEEVVALLNQIINSPEFEKILPIKLQDPMLIDSSNLEVDLLNNIESSTNLKEMKSNIIKEISSLTNAIGSQVSLGTMEIDNVSKEALNLTNIILETLNSKNINEVLSTDEVKALKSALEGLTSNLFEKLTVMPEVVNEVKLGVKEVKNIEINSEIEVATEGKEKNIITELKSLLNNETKLVEVTNNTKVNTVVTPIETESTEVSEEEKILSKILGENESGSLNRQSNLFNRLNVSSSSVIKEPMVVSKETMDADIIKNVKFMMKNAVSELKVKIYPKELGEMTIKLLSEEGILKADIRATSKETYNLLHSNLSDIKKSLEHQNIKIHEVNISLYSDDTTYNSGENSRDEMFKNNENKQGKSSTGESSILSDELDEEVIFDDNSVNLLV